MKRITGLLYSLIFFISIQAVAACPGSAQFTFSSPVCINNAATFTNTSSGAGVSTYTWVWGDATANTVVGNTASQTHTYTSAGVFTVKLIRVFGNGCKDSVTHNITIVNNTLAPPTFSFLPNNACSGTAVSFSNTTGGGLSTAWNFGDPGSGGQNTSTNPNASHTFSAVGSGGSTNYNVTLTTTNAAGCSNSATQTVVVSNKPDATLADSNIFSPFSNCGNPNLTPATPEYHIAVTNASTTQSTNTGYTISWGDGTPNFSGASFTQVDHDYPALGIYNIVFTVTGPNGCSDSHTYQVFNLTNPSVGLNSPGNTIGCAPITLTFPVTLDSANLNFTTYTFDFNDGSPKIVWTPPGVFTSITHIFNTASCGKPGNQFTVQVTAKNACDSTTATVNSIKISSKPSTQFTATPNPGCVGVPVLFTNTTVPGCNAATGSTVTQYVWNFGDGTPATAPSTSNAPQSHTYSAMGTYTVTLTGTSSCGNSTYSVPVKIMAPPLALFTITPPACVPVTITTTNQSTGDSLTYFWNATPGGWSFAGGTTATDVSPKFTFSTAGTYTITLITTNPCGSQQKDTVITVKDKPGVTEAPVANACVPLVVNASAVYTTGGGTISAYGWTFTGGSPASAATQTPPAVTYNAAGTYSIIASATNECGTAKDTVIVTVTPQPIANAGSDVTLCNGSPATIGVASTAGYSYSWSSAPAGFSSSTSNPVVTPTVTTTYYVSTNGGGCAKTDSCVVTVNPLPTVSAGNPQTVCVTASAFSLTGTPVGGTWTGTGVNAGGTFNPQTTGAGSFTLSYHFTSGATGCTDSSTVLITVDPVPAVSAGPDFTACNQAGTVTLSGYSPAGGVWSGTGITAGGVFTPATAGVGPHNLIYTFTTGTGCVGKDTLVATVQNPSAAVAGANDTVCVNASAFNLSGFSPVGGTWSGTGITNTALGTFDPAIATAGTYTLTYTFGTGTCQTASTKEVVVDPAPVLNAGINQSICADVTAFNLSGNTPAGGTWSGTGISNAATGTFDPSVSGAGTFTLTYAFSDPLTGCSNTSTKTLTVNALPIVNAGVGTVYCDQPATLSLSGYSPAGGTWSGAGIVSAVSGTFDPSLPALGKDTLKYTFTDANGCTNSDTIINTIIAPSTAIAGANDTVCLSASSFALTGFSPAGGNWSGTAVTGAGIFTPSTAGAGTFTLTYTYGVGTCQTTATKSVVVNALPLVNAGASQTVCVNSPSFSLSGFSPAGGSWSGTGITNASNGTFDPAASGVGSFIMTYTFTDPLTNCSNTDTSVIAVNSLPAVNAGTGYTVCDQPITVTLAGYSPAGGTWSGTGVTAAGVFDPATAGLGNTTLSYSFTSGIGCTVTDTIVMTVIAPQVAVAGANDTICLNNGLLNFSGFTPAGGTWSGTGISNASGVFDPAVSGVGTFTATYTYGAGTCLTSATKTVLVKPLPVINAGVNENTCISTSAYALSGYSPAGGSWSGAGVSASGIFDPSLAGVGTVTLTYTYTDPVTNCTDTRTKTITVGALPVVAFTNPSVACINASVSFTNTTTGATSYSWSFGDGGTSVATGPAHTYTATGNYTIHLLAASSLGCLDSATKNIQLIAPPVAGFVPAPDSGCGPLTVNFTNNSSGDFISYSWNLGNGTIVNDTTVPAQIYTQGIYDTTYSITLTVSNQCATSVYSDSILVLPIPAVGFGTNFSQGCSPFTPLFNNTSTGNATTYIWDFGDGTANSNAVIPPGHTYFTGSSDSTYTITLIGINQCGSDTIQRQIIVHPNTVTAFFNTSSTSGCAQHTVTFTDFSTGGTFISWNFGDGNVSTQASPAHTYVNPGTYTCYQAVNNGCSYDTSTVVITVYPPPTLSFSTSPPSSCINQPVTFTNTSTSSINFNWNFGDGTTSNLVSPVHNFAAAGTYTVTMVGTSQTYGCIDSIAGTIVIYTPPVPQIASDVSFGCEDLSVNFSNNSSNATFYTWNFGDGNTSVQNSPSHIYTGSGTYTVTLVAQNLNSCKDSMQIQINVYPKPSAAFTLSAAYSCSLPAIVTLTNNSNGASGYVWSLGNGQTTSVNSPTVTYVANGTYTILLVASNTYGCVDTSFNSYSVYPTPQILFTPSATIGCQPLAVTYTNGTQNGNTYLWTFSDGSTSTAITPTHVYQNPGVYGATLIATSFATCSDTVSLPNSVTVNPSPTAGFNYNQLYSDGVPNGTIQFLNTSTGASAYAWSFGDGGTGIEVHPEHQYPGIGTYTATLIVTNQYQCADTATLPVTVDYFQGLFVPNAFIASSPFPDLAVFLPKGKTIKEYKLQVFNTWGTLLWETEKLDDNGSPVEGWDGTYKGELCAQDVYVWKIEARFKNESLWMGKKYENGEVKNTGTITLIR
ncbi:MAG: PKD domain-containing protein [Bacteroidia bacterium]